MTNRRKRLRQILECRNEFGMLLAIALLGTLVISIHSGGREGSESGPQVLVAQRDMAVGTPVLPLDFRYESRTGQEGAVTDQQWHKLRGAVLRRSLSSGDALLWRDLTVVHGKNLRLGERVPQGRRAYGIRPANELDVFPGDWVDILEAPRNGVARPLFDSVKILQVARIHGEFSVTIAVTSHDIAVLEKAEQRGKLLIALQNPKELRNGPQRRSHAGDSPRQSIEIWSEDL